MISSRQIVFYFGSFVTIMMLLSLFYGKMFSTYEAKENFLVINELSNKFKNKEKIIVEDLRKSVNLNVSYNSQQLKDYLTNIDYRACLKYSTDYIDSHFTSITVNDSYFSRKDLIRRDLMLEKCDKKFNNIIINQRI